MLLACESRTLFVRRHDGGCTVILQAHDVALLRETASQGNVRDNIGQGVKPETAVFANRTQMLTRVRCCVVERLAVSSRKCGTSRSVKAVQGSERCEAFQILRSSAWRSSARVGLNGSKHKPGNGVTTVMAHLVSSLTGHKYHLLSPPSQVCFSQSML